MRTSLRNGFALLALSSLVLSGCAAEAILEPLDEPVIVVEEEVIIDVPRHPLTGVELGSSVVSGPSIAVKIDNTSSGRP